MKEMLADVPARLAKSYKHRMVGGEGVLPCRVTYEISTEPLVNTIHGWGSGEEVKT